jgi:hypothetical protein
MTIDGVLTRVERHTVSEGLGDRLELGEVIRLAPAIVLPPTVPYSSICGSLDFLAAR